MVLAGIGIPRGSLAEMEGGAGVLDRHLDALLVGLLVRLRGASPVHRRVAVADQPVREDHASRTDALLGLEVSRQREDQRLGLQNLSNLKWELGEERAQLAPPGDLEHPPQSLGEPCPIAAIEEPGAPRQSHGVSVV